MTIGFSSPERYREDYIGEYVITKIIIKDGNKEQKREWIENPLTITQTSNRATCIAEQNSIKDSFYKQVQKNNGGNLGKLKMQVYGVDSVWTKMTPNFTVCKIQSMLEDMIKSSFTKESIVYTSSSKCIKYPGEFYLTPYNMSLNSHALAIWLACFDGHNEVYIVGFDFTNQKIVNTVSDVMKIYKSVKFIQVTNNNSPHEWKQLLNFSVMTQNQYVRHCDI